MHGRAGAFRCGEDASVKPPSLEYAWLLEKLIETRGGLRRGIKGLLKGSPLRGVQPKFPAIRQRLFRTGQSAFKNKLADGSLRGEGGSLEGALRGWGEAEVDFLSSRFDILHVNLLCWLRVTITCLPDSVMTIMCGVRHGWVADSRMGSLALVSQTASVALEKVA